MGVIRRLLFPGPQAIPDKERDQRRADVLAQVEEIRDLWDRHIGGPRGIVPGATLDPMRTPRGWVGHVQGTIDNVDALAGNGRRVLAARVAQVYDLPKGAVLVDHGLGSPDTVFVWAYERPGVVDYHERLPHSVFGRNLAGKPVAPGELTELERGELADWARKHRDMLSALARGRRYDMEQVVRRYNRMRAAILDALTRATPTEVREIIAGAGLDAGELGRDIGKLLGVPDRR